VTVTDCVQCLLVVDWLSVMLCVCLFSLILDNERWKQADVPAEFQDLVDHIGTTGQPQLSFA